MLNYQKNQPIGVFDSGVGGLTVAHAITRLLPDEHLVYFGDTAHLPYGDKSPKAIQQYSEKISRFLLMKSCKAIVIACNTASSFAYEHLVHLFGESISIINVIDPVVEFVCSNESVKKVGVIGTKGTIQSGIYEQKIKAQSTRLSVQSLATPLFVPLIEEGFIQGEIGRMVIHEYLARPDLQGIDSLILACTHYPLIKTEIERFYNNKVNVVDSATIVAAYVKECLGQKDLLNDKDKSGQRFYVSDYTPVFEQIANQFFEEKISLEFYPIWNN